MKKITQSFIKSYLRYLRGDECGNIITWCWVEGKLIPSTKAQKLGIYYEYCVSGALPKDKQIPRPEYMKNGKDMYKPYRDAYQNAGKVKQMLEDRGMTIVSAGVQKSKGKYSGTIDLIVEAKWDIIFEDGFVLKKGGKAVIDLKYSGLIGDKWNEMGWNIPELTDDQKEYHGIQATQYHYITSLPFFYLIHGSKNTRDGDRNQDNEDDPTNGWPIEFFRMDVSERAIKKHIALGNELEEQFEEAKKIGFPARPRYSKCVKCPIAYQCKDKHTFPEPIVVKL